LEFEDFKASIKNTKNQGKIADFLEMKYKGYYGKKRKQIKAKVLYNGEGKKTKK
jgi:hypothetical protein